MVQTRIGAILLLLAGLGVGYFVYSSETDSVSRFPFKLGLDLTGGTHLLYEADTSGIPQGPNRAREVDEAMSALRDVIERRVNLFGVTEPLVQTEEAGLFAESEAEQRLIVELPGITDVDEAIRLIGETPELEFKLVVDPTATATAARFAETGLTGRFVEGAQMAFQNSAAGAVTNEPIIVVEFNGEGASLFEELTSQHVGEQLAIFLDGQLLSDPVIREPIPGGEAVISGGFTAEEARELARDIDFGALPVPIELVSTQSVGPSLGSETTERGVVAGLVGLGTVALFLVFWYRLPGVAAVAALAIYIAVMLALFKLIPVTLTAAGVAGFILSIGLAVDANVLIFERLKEELRLGKGLELAVRDGFSRAWLPIRDGNASSVLTAIILFWFGTSIVEGFALTFGIGILISMLTAITVTRTFLLAMAPVHEGGAMRTLFGSGLK